MNLPSHDQDVDPFPDVPAFNDTMREAIADCNGFVYLGGDMEAQIRFVKWMRTHPDKAAVLLSNEYELIGYMGKSTHLVFDSPARGLEDRFIPVYREVR